MLTASSLGDMYGRFRDQVDGSQSVNALSVNNTYVIGKFKMAGTELDQHQYKVVNDINLKIAVNTQSQNIHLDHPNMLVITTGSLGI